MPAVGFERRVGTHEGRTTEAIPRLASREKRAALSRRRVPMSRESVTLEARIEEALHVARARAVQVAPRLERQSSRTETPHPRAADSRRL